MDELGDDENELVCFFDFKQFENVWVVDVFQDLKFLLDSLNVFRSLDFLFLQHLYCNFLSCWYMGAFPDFAEGSSAYNFAYFEISNDFLFVAFRHLNQI